MTHDLYSCPSCDGHGVQIGTRTMWRGKKHPYPYAVGERCACRTPRPPSGRPEVFPNWDWYTTRGRLVARVGEGPDLKSYWLYRRGTLAVYHADVDDFVRYAHDPALEVLYQQIMGRRPKKDTEA